MHGYRGEIGCGGWNRGVFVTLHCWGRLEMIEQRFGMGLRGGSCGCCGCRDIFALRCCALVTRGSHKTECECVCMVLGLWERGVEVVVWCIEVRPALRPR